MSNSTNYNVADFQQALLRGFKAKLEEISKEELETACINMERRMREQLDTMAINLLSYYEIHRMGERLIIEVKKND